MLTTIRSVYVKHGRLFFHAGFWTVLIYRYGVWTLSLKFRPWRYLHSAVYLLVNGIFSSINKIELDRTTKIGADLHLIHGAMIQIHTDAVIGDRCGIMHGVTIGNNNDRPSVPVIGNDVFIGCNASVLGDVTIGDNARIAANSLVISDVPAGAVAMGVPARIIPGMAALRGLGGKAKRPPRRAAQAPGDAAPTHADNAQAQES